MWDVNCVFHQMSRESPGYVPRALLPSLETLAPGCDTDTAALADICIASRKYLWSFVTSLACISRIKIKLDIIKRFDHKCRGPFKKPFQHVRGILWGSHGSSVCALGAALSAPGAQGRRLLSDLGSCRAGDFNKRKGGGCDCSVVRATVNVLSCLLGAWPGLYFGHA